MAVAIPKDQASFMLSPVHAMLEQISTVKDVEKLNEHLNHPDVIEWVRGEAVGGLDGSDLLKSDRVVMLHGDHGSMLVVCIMDGMYDIHIQVLPEGRGKWSQLFFRACLHLVFTNMNAVEIIMRRPHGNLPILTMIRAIGGDYQFTSPQGYVVKHKKIAVDTYTLTIQRWINTAPGLKERGAWLNSRLTASVQNEDGSPCFPDDEPNMRQVGAAMEMFLAGNVGKGVIFYNRWAFCSDRPPVTLRCAHPITLDIGSAMLIVREKDMWVPTCHSQQP